MSLTPGAVTSRYDPFAVAQPATAVISCWAAWAKISGVLPTKPASIDPAWKAWSIGGPPMNAEYSTL